jgi:hypothetical protein
MILYKYGTAPSSLFRRGRRGRSCHPRGRAARHPATAAVTADPRARTRARRAALSPQAARRRADAGGARVVRRGEGDPRSGRGSRGGDTARGARRGRADRLGFTSSASFHPFVPRAIRAFREPIRWSRWLLRKAGRPNWSTRCAPRRSTPPLSAPRSARAPTCRPAAARRADGRRAAKRTSVISYRRQRAAAGRRSPVRPSFSIGGRLGPACTTRSSPLATAPGSARRLVRKRRACCRL